MESKAIGQYVIILPNRGETRKSQGGLDMPTELIDRFLSGTVMSVSPMGTKEWGIEEGMEVLYDKNAGHEFTHKDGERYKIVTCHNIAMVY